MVFKQSILAHKLPDLAIFKINSHSVSNQSIIPTSI